MVNSTEEQKNTTPTKSTPSTSGTNTIGLSMSGRIKFATSENMESVYLQGSMVQNSFYLVCILNHYEQEL